MLFFYSELNVLKLGQPKSNIQICFCEQSKAFRVITLWAVTFIIEFILYVNNPMNLNEAAKYTEKWKRKLYLLLSVLFRHLFIFFSNIEYPNESGRIDPKIYIEINLMYKNVNFVVISISFLIGIPHELIL